MTKYRLATGSEEAFKRSRLMLQARWGNHVKVKRKSRWGDNFLSLPKDKQEKVREKHRLAMQSWRLKNKEKNSISNKRYKARKKGASGFHTYQEWEELKQKCGYTCLKCLKKEPEIKLTEDHIIPLSQGGSDFISNIQPLCRSCNTSKSTKTISYPISLTTTSVYLSS